MHISFETNHSPNAEKITTSYQSPAGRTAHAAGGYKLDISEKVTDNTAYGCKKSRGLQGRSMEEVMQQAEGADVAAYRNYMTVMSNSMSDEDFARLEKDGYNPQDMDPRDTVTILDTIKAELVKAGENIVGYTDDMDSEKLAEITGSEAFANALTNAFAKEDLPLTPENVDAAMEAFSIGQKLTELSDGAMKYMVLNDMNPEIENLYLAQHAGAVNADKQGRGYFPDEMPGYYAQKAEPADTDKLTGQIEKIIESAGYPVNDETLRDGSFLIEKGIPLTQESFAKYEQLKDTTLPPEDAQILEGIAGAIADGKPATEANLYDGRSIYRKAADCFTSYQAQYEEILRKEPTPENAKARRQLEEVRLHMTVEANVKLLKSGFSIDTEPIEKTIQALKDLERSQVQTPYAEKAPADICKETLQKTREIPFLPSYTLGDLLSRGRELTVDAIHETGKALEESLRRANASYETMMTAPRADLGDSIRQAFRNVDELLTHMGQELTDENRKAVRSISYNHMELTEENLLAVKGADAVVRRVVEKMTPSAVLSMIRDGVNPLETSMEGLDRYLTERDVYTEESAKYSRFLYQLEQSGEISAEEKASFIGIYRLLRQIEKTDGAAVGKLVDERAELNFANLLSAVRTGRVRGIDIAADEAFGSLKEAVSAGVSIDTQIESAYRKNPAWELRDTEADGSEAALLKTWEEPVTLDAILSVRAMQEDGARPFKRLAAGHGELLRRSFEEEVFSDKESFTDSYQDMVTQGEAILKEMTFAEADGSLDVRALQLACKQLHIQGVRALQQEEYDIPQEIDGEWVSLHLKLVHDSENGGRMSIEMQSTRFGALFGEFSLQGDTLSGYLAGDGDETGQMLENAVPFLQEKTEQAGLSLTPVRIIRSSMRHPLAGSPAQNTETKNLYRVSGMVISAIKQSIHGTISR